MKMFRKQGARCWICKRTVEEVKQESKFADYGVKENYHIGENALFPTKWGNVCICCRGILDSELANLRVSKQ